MASSSSSTDENSLPAFEPTGSYWNQRYVQQSTGWDLGQVSPPIRHYIDQLGKKDFAILIPGCGNAYEAWYLLDQGFTDITLIDIAPKPVTDLQNAFGNNPNVKLIAGDFFELNRTFDLILEQTFFCALPPDMRSAYAKKMAALLNENGKLVGLLFNRKFEQEGPPFGGNQEEYIELFEPYFYLKQISSCINSFEKRAGTELFINFQRK